MYQTLWNTQLTLILKKFNNQFRLENPRTQRNQEKKTYEQVRRNEVLQPKDKKIRLKYRVVFTIDKATKTIKIEADWSHYEKNLPQVRGKLVATSFLFKLSEIETLDSTRE